MARLLRAGWIAGVVCGLLAQPAFPAGKLAERRPCAGTLAQQIAARRPDAPGGQALLAQMMELSGDARDRVLAGELLAGNVPSFLRRLAPVTFSGAGADGAPVRVTLCVTPDYLAVGSDADFVRVPLGLPAAAEIADRFGFLLPTTRMVDAIYAQAPVRLKPSPMPPTAQMRSTDYLLRHNRTVDGQQHESGGRLGVLTAGQKKDLVLSNRLKSAPGRVAIYGWHRSEGAPIQPLSTVHGERYADYSHGVRLVSATAFVNGAPRQLAALLQDPALARIVSSEGPIAEPRVLQASLYRGWEPDTAITATLASAKR